MTPARFVRIARQRLAALARPSAVQRDIDREIAAHLEELVRERIEGGLDPDTARREAHREFGPVAAITERSRDARGLTAIAGVLDDARYGVRLLRRAPGFTTIAALALAVGVGATAASLAWIAFVLARPLPFTDGDRLIVVRTSAADTGPFARAITLHEYLAWSARATTIAAIGASHGGPHVLTLEGSGAVRVQGQTATPGLFAMLGIRPGAGRLFEPADSPFDRRALVTVISHRLWQQRFGGASDTVGRRIRVDGTLREIIGILPADFRLYGEGIDIWIPLIPLRPAEHVPAHDAPHLAVIARLRAGATVDDARAELGSIAAGLHPERTRAALDVMPLRERLYGWTRPRLITIGAMAGLLLALTCANLAALLLARGTLRRRELAMRAALGAPRRRLVRQLLTESLVLGGAAAVPAIVVAAAGMRAVAAALGAPPGLPRLASGGLDAWSIAAVAALCGLSAALFGVLPAAAASRTDPIEAAAVQRRRSPALTVASWRAALVGIQVALAEVLLIAGTLLSVSYANLIGRELNFEPRGLLSFTYSIRAGDVIRPRSEGDGFDVSAAAADTMQRVLDRLERLPGVVRAAGISVPPVNSLILPIVNVQALEAGRATAPARAAYVFVTPGAFTTLRTPIRQGREFAAGDERGAPWTVVVNEAMAETLWPGANPLGRRVRIDLGDGEQPREVIGVVGNIPARLEQTRPQPIVYTSHAQQPLRYRGPAVGIFAAMTFVMRTPDLGSDTSDTDRGLIEAARHAIADIAPDRPLEEPGTVHTHLFALTAERRNYVVALDVLALISVLLAVVGLHAVTTHAVAGRANELAVRRALGARRRQIAAIVVGPTLTVAAAAIVVGAASASAGAGLLSTQLFGVGPADSSAFAGVSLALLAAACAGCVGACRRAMRIDPGTRLRCE